MQLPVMRLAAIVAALLSLPLSAGADDLEQELCGGASPCFIASVQPAGENTAGQLMQVVEVVFGTRDQDWKTPSFGGECVRYQYWLLHRLGTTVEHKQLLLDLCNDGYGASGMGEDTITVSPNRLAHSQVGGSAWRWSYGTTIQLSPLRVLTEGTSGYWTLGPNGESSSWDWQTFSGKQAWGAPMCDAEGAPVVDESAAIGDTDREYARIPAVTLADPLGPGGRGDVDLGECAMTVDSTGAGGYVTHGKPGAAGDASFRAVVISPRTLLVEVSDDTWTHGASSWLYDDHLEIWTTGKDGAYLWSGHCLDGKPPTQQWGVRIHDGEVFPAHGKPPRNPTVDHLGEHGGAVRLRLEFPEDIEGISVVYSDSDDGKTQERLLATSPVKFGDAFSLGGLYTVRPEQAVCAVEEGRLVIRPTATYTPDKPVIRGP